MCVYDTFQLLIVLLFHVRSIEMSFVEKRNASGQTTKVIAKFGRGKEVCISPFLGLTYMHLSNPAKQKSVTLNIGEVKELALLLGKVPQYDDIFRNQQVRLLFIVNYIHKHDREDWYILFHHELINSIKFRWYEVKLYIVCTIPAFAVLFIFVFLQYSTKVETYLSSLHYSIEVRGISFTISLKVEEMSFVEKRNLNGQTTNVVAEFGKRMCITPFLSPLMYTYLIRRSISRWRLMLRKWRN